MKDKKEAWVIRFDNSLILEVEGLIYPGRDLVFKSEDAAKKHLTKIAVWLLEYTEGDVCLTNDRRKLETTGWSSTFVLFDIYEDDPIWMD